jgi:hypothetical protein
MNTFGWAIKEMQNGARVRRTGWNGKGMFIAIQPGSIITAAQARGGVAKFLADDGQKDITILPHIDMKAATGEVVVGWLASQTDMLSTDWEIAN